jgi:hypothetical protein
VAGESFAGGFCFVMVTVAPISAGAGFRAGGGAFAVPVVAQPKATIPRTQYLNLIDIPHSLFLRASRPAA